MTIFEADSLLRRSQAGDAEARGQLLDHFRPYLIVIAQRQLDSRLQGRLDAADVVQTTFLEAHRDFESFRGQDIDTLLAWLRNILHHNVETFHQQHLTALKRSVKREQSPYTAVNQSTPAPIEQMLPSDTTSPSQRAMRDEAAASLAISLATLPPTQAEAIRLRYLEGYSVRQIADRMAKTEMAVAGLLKRGLQSLRVHLDD